MPHPPEAAPPDDLLVFNGIDGKTGQYLIPPMTSEQLIAVVLAEKKEQRQRDELARDRSQSAELPDFAPLASLDPKNLGQVGWGVIFPATLPRDTLAALREALGELLAHRSEQAGPFYKEFSGGDGYQPEETAKEWLNRHNASFGRVDPREGVPPYYLLIVGDPNTIPYHFQYNLDVDRAVGRIYFETIDEFARYAHSVVAAERRQVARARQAVFFGVSNFGDNATTLSAQYLVAPLVERLTAGRESGNPEEQRLLAGWQFEHVAEADATKARLQRLLGGDQTPALLFTASHGVGFRPGDPEQLAMQGALVCQDWPGPAGGGIKREHYLAAEDIPDGASPFGMVCFHFACYGAGTPHLDEFYQRYNQTRGPIAPYAFLAQLPRRLLAHPRGGALAVVGHVERAWTHSFKWETSRQHTSNFYDVLCQLMDGQPVGHAMDAINTLYGSISAQLTHELAEHTYTPRSPGELANLWTGNNDARNYMVIGDPAVALAVAPDPASVKAAPLERAAPSLAGALPPVLDPAADPRGLAQPAAPSATPPAPAPLPSGDAEAFGLGSDTLRGIAADLAEALRSLAVGVRAAADLEVRTFVADDLDSARFGADGMPTVAARQRALTRVRLNGSTDVIVPARQNELDDAIWAIHRDTVAQAAQGRAELLRVLTELVAGFLPRAG